MAEEEKKDTDQMNLKVVGQDGQVIQFKIKRNTPFRKLMTAYCDRTKVVQSTVRFTFDGSRINDNDTPKTMDMDDGDTIEVFTQQTGGGFSNCFSPLLYMPPYVFNITEDKNPQFDCFENKQQLFFVIRHFLILTHKSNRIIKNKEYSHYDTH